MATASSTVSVSRPRFGRPERTEIRAGFTGDVLADMKSAYLADGRLRIHPVSDFIKSVVDHSGLIRLRYQWRCRCRPPALTRRSAAR